MTGDIAIDDITFTNCEMPPVKSNCNKFTCANQACIDVSRVCDFTDDCGDYSDEQNCDSFPARCDFENGGICSWSQMDDDQFDWSLGTGVRCRPDTGPCVDHTTYTRDGHFLYLNSVDRKSGRTQLMLLLFATSYAF